MGGWVGGWVDDVPVGVMRSASRTEPASVAAWLASAALSCGGSGWVGGWVDEGLCLLLLWLPLAGLGGLEL